MSTENPESRCPGCGHDQHLPGTECSAGINHGTSVFHLCLCLARPGANQACPPQMKCQGGTLRYAELWYLQQGISLVNAEGQVSPEVVKVEPVASSEDTDRARFFNEAADLIDRTYTGPGIDRFIRYGADLLRRTARKASR